MDEPKEKLLSEFISSTITEKIYKFIIEILCTFTHTHIYTRARAHIYNQAMQ